MFACSSANSTALNVAAKPRFRMLRPLCSMRVMVAGDFTPAASAKSSLRHSSSPLADFICFESIRLNGLSIAVTLCIGKMFLF